MATASERAPSGMLRAMKILLGSLALVALVACGDDSTSATGTGGGGAGGASTSSSSASTSSGTTTSHGNQGGAGGAGGEPEGASTGTTSSSDGGAGGDTVTTGSTTSTGSGGGGASPGCGNAGAPAGEAVRNLTIQGVERRFIVDAPAVIDVGKPLSLVFVFHGNGGTGQGIQGMGIQNAEGAQDNAVFVFPDGLPFKGFGVGWNGHCDGYDMEFFDTMVATLSADYCIDPSRIFAAGFSWGGDMCESLACCRGDVVRGIAPASGPELYPAMECPGTTRPAFRMTYATHDAYPPEMFADRIDFFRTEHACAQSSSPIEPSPCIAYDDCDEPVIACEYEGLGHAWPQDYGAETWKFFSQLP